MSLAAVGEAASGAASLLFGASQAKKNRKFQERMFRHRYQYASEDMKAAGINPILAAGSGLGGGGSPSGSAASGNISGVGNALTKATDVRSSVRLRKKQGELLDAQIGREHSVSDMNTASAASIRAQTMRYEPISDIGGALGKVTERVRSGDMWTAVKTVMGGNAQEAAKLKQEISEYFRTRRDNHNARQIKQWRTSK